MKMRHESEGEHIEQRKENIFDNQPRAMSYECWDLKGIVILILLCNKRTSLNLFDSEE